jgi:hypothetical protein
LIGQSTATGAMARAAAPILSRCEQTHHATSIALAWRPVACRSRGAPHRAGANLAVATDPVDRALSLTKAVASRSVVKRFAEFGVEPAPRNTPQPYADLMRAEARKWGKLNEDLNITVDWDFPAPDVELFSPLVGISAPARCLRQVVCGHRRGRPWPRPTC